MLPASIPCKNFRRDKFIEINFVNSSGEKALTFLYCRLPKILFNIVNIFLQCLYLIQKCSITCLVRIRLTAILGPKSHSKTLNMSDHLNYKQFLLSTLNFQDSHIDNLDMTSYSYNNIVHLGYNNFQ